MSKRKALPPFTEWLPDESSVFGRREVGVTVAPKLSTATEDYLNIVTVEIFSSDSDDEALDSDCPDPMSGAESVALTPDGARALAALLVKAADKADAARARR